MNRQHDLNFLFIVFALKHDFLSRDDFRTLLATLDQHQKVSIGKSLVDSQRLTVEQEQQLDRFIQEHLSEHDGDIDASVAAVCDSGILDDQLQTLAGNETCRSALMSVGDGSLYATMMPTGDQEANGTHDRDPDQTKVVDQTQVGATGFASGTSASSLERRFEFLRMHAKGGLGEIHVARDKELNREVALKEIQDHLADDAASRRRFIVEGEVTGSLEHPGVVPVYGMGADANGRPYYAMRFIRGESLKEAIADFHVKGAHDFDAGKQTLALHKLLRRFVDVCNTVHYAHSRGVLHRDLKPDNVMLGPYGETLVVDWGLAKMIGRDEEIRQQTDEVTLQPGSNPDGEQTQQGSVVGTLQYMSPEQALGWHNRLTPASDVFSLGAILYRLLTNKPLYAGRQLTEVHQKVIECDVASPRQVDRDIPLPLAAICQKALAKNATGRYQTSLAMAEDIEAYLADEPISAAPEPFTLRARRWMRHHHTLVVTSLSTLLLGIIGLAGTAALLSMKNAEVAQQRDAVQEQRDEVQRQRDEVRNQRDLVQKQKDEVQKQRDVAQANLQASRQAVWDSFIELSEDDRLKTEGLRELRGDLLNASAPFYEKFLAQNPDDPQLRFEQARWRYQLGLNVYELQSRRDALDHIVQSADILKKLVGEFPENLLYQRHLVSALGTHGVIRRDLGEYDRAKECFREGLKIADGIPIDFDPTRLSAPGILRSSDDRQTVPGLRVGLHVSLGDTDSLVGNSADADMHYQTARKVELQFREQFPQDRTLFASGALTGLANLQTRRGDRVAGIETLNKALQELEQFSPTESEKIGVILNRAGVRNAMGILYSNMSRLHAAGIEFRKALELIEPLREKHSGNIAFQELENSLRNNRNLDSTQLQTQRNAESVTEDQLEAVARYQLLSDANPDVATYQLGLVIMQRTLAAHFLSQQQPDEAMEQLELSLDLNEKILTRDPLNPEHRLSKVWSLLVRSDALSQQGDNNAATKDCKQAVEISQKYLEKQKNVDFRAALSDAWRRLTNLAYMEGNYELADECAKIHADVIDKYPEPFKQTPVFDDSRALNLQMRADMRFQRGDPKAGFDLQLEALQLRQGLVERFPDEPAFKFSLSGLHQWISDSMASNGIEVYGPPAMKKLVTHFIESGKAVSDIDPEYLPVYRLEGLVNIENYLADYEYGLGNREPTLEHVKKSLRFSEVLYGIRQQSTYLISAARNQIRLGDLLIELDQNKEALRQYDAALKTAEKILIQHGSGDRQARELRAVAYTKRGELLYQTKQWKKSLVAFEQAVEIGGIEDSIDPRVKRSMVHAKLGDHATAVLLVSAAMRLPRAEATDFYNAACAYSLAIEAAGDDAKLEKDLRTELVETYANKALEWLQQAKKRGAFRDAGGLASLNDDPDLNGVREREEFRELVGEVEQALR